MQLITILLVAVAVLTIFTGLAILCGSTKQSRAQGAWFFVATIGAAVWATAIAAFLSLPEENAPIFPTIVTGIVAGITLTDVALLGYTSWTEDKKGKILTVLFGVLGVGLVSVLAVKPELFYDDVSFGRDFNSIHTVQTWYFYAILGYFFLISLGFSGALGREIKRIKNKGAKNGLKIFRGGLSVGGILALLFDLLLLSSQPQLAWIGPMAVSISILTFYYSVVRYRIIALSGKWVQFLSYVILAAAGVVVYTLIFYVVFTAIFRIPNPSSEVLILNFIMVIIVLCLMPAISELSSLIRAFLPTRQIDLGYITRRLNGLSKQNIELKELASFLAQQLKLEYVGFLIHGRLYGSRSIDATSDDLVKIEKLKLPKHGIWQDFQRDITEEDEVVKITVMENSRGEVYGQVLIGRPTSRRVLERRELIQIEMVLQLAATIIDEESGVKTK